MSVDPGKHTGWATWEFGLGDPHLLQMGVTKNETEFYDMLIKEDWMNFGYLVAEDYKIYPKAMKHGWSQQWSGAPAIHIIGALELFARQHGMQIKMQPSSVLPVGCGYIGYSYRKNVHVPNNISAIAHGAYWLVKNKYANSRGFKVLASKDTDNSIESS